MTNAINAIRGIQHPTNWTGCKSFLGLCNEFRRLLPSFARKAAALSRKLESNQAFHFGQLKKMEINALGTLQHLFLSLPILLLSRQNVRHTLDTDACEQ